MTKHTVALTVAVLRIDDHSTPPSYSLELLKMSPDGFPMNGGLLFASVPPADPAPAPPKDNAGDS